MTFRNALLLGGSLAVAWLLAEIILRYAGVKPGLHCRDANFTPVPSLFNLKGFYADSEGIFKTDPETKKDFDQRLAAADLASSAPLYDWEKEIDEIYSVLDNMRDVMAGRVKNDFSAQYQSLLQKPPHELTDLDSALLQFVRHPLNEDGFLSIPFKKYRSGKRVLLLGDSFTWGRTVPNITSSFACILLAKGYAVYNTGISGSDVPQYLAVAKKYIPLLQPDFVIVNFYMGNDISYFPRPVKPFQFVMYRTNAGYLMACNNGVCFGSAEEAYHFVKNQCAIPPTSLFNRCCSHSALGTMLWAQLNRTGLVDNIHPENAELLQQMKKPGADVPYCNTELDTIRQIAATSGSRCIISVMRDMAHENQYDPSQVHRLLENIPYVISPVKEDGYSKGDWHYNEKGHREYAEFLDSLMKAQ